MQTNTIFANAVLTANGWVKDARLRLENGRIAAIWRKVRVKGHAQAVLEAVRQL